MSSTVLPVGGVLVQLIDDGDAIVRMTKNNKEWEPRTRSVWGGMVRPGDTVIDVGAYTGVYAIAAALIGAKVIALEPHPANYQRLRDNAAINSVRIDMIEAAASDREGEGILYVKREATAMCDTASLEEALDVGMTVPTMRLDSLKLKARVGLIKIDTEHHELGVLKGAVRILTTHRPIIVAECLSPGETQIIDVFLAGLGYKPDIILDNRNHFYRHTP